MYRADLKIKPKLESLETLKKVIPNYIAEINFVSYLFDKASANQNDKRRDEEGCLPDGVVYGKISFEDQDKEMAKVRIIHDQLIELLKIEEIDELLDDTQDLWNCLSLRKKYYSDATNQLKSKNEEKFESLLLQKSNKLNKDFIEYYKAAIQLYQKGKSA